MHQGILLEGVRRPDADGARVATETERRAQELGNAMLNAARPYMDVNLDRQGLPVAVTPRDFFAFLEAVTTHNNRTPAMKDKASGIGRNEPSRH